ncbi:fat storage-inducing transmembrane protein 1 [Leuresthes tenuis]|uniref:fat storage-inducing transmembrane protein 1 n=1 Tax=Leuresthes tenuis TaxID=355514 RepID=UPI003B50B1E2
MDPKTGSFPNGLKPEINLEKLHKLAAQLMLPGRFVLRPLSAALEILTNTLAWILGSRLVRRHFHLMLSGLVLFGPVLSLWASKYSIFANSNHYLYRKFLRSTWGWTCLLTGSFVLVLSFSACRCLSLSLRHVSRLGLAGVLWWGCRRLLTLLEDATGTCYEPMAPAQDVQSTAAPPLLLLHEDLTKASCLKANMLWRGYEVSQDILILSFCCLLLAEEMSVIGRHLAQERRLLRSPGAPCRLLFLLCVLLLIIWMFLLLCLLVYFPKWPSQQLGGALGYLGWMGLYQGWYRLRVNWGSPGLPGEGLFTATDCNKRPQ